MLSVTLRKIKPMQKTILIISNGVGLLQLSLVQREKRGGVSSTNSIPPTSRWGRGFSRKTWGVAGRTSISLWGSFCGRYVPGWHWDKAAQHRWERPQPQCRREGAGLGPEPLGQRRASSSAAMLLTPTPALVLSLVSTVWDWGEEGEQEGPVRHAVFALPRSV